MGLVADAAEMRDEFVERNFLVPRQRARLSGVRCRVSKTHASRGYWRDHHTSEPAGVAPQGNRACFENFRVRGNFLPGQRIEGGKDGYFCGLLTRERLVEELHRCGQSFRARARCDDYHNGPAKICGDVSSDQCLGGIRQSSDKLMRDFM